MSFKSLVNKLMKEGKSKAAATKSGGSVANAKMKGAGSGPTAKQKARAKSPAKKKTKKKVVTVSNTAAEKKRSVKVYRKDGTLKSETTSRRGNAGFDKKGTYKGSTKKETRYSASPRNLKTKAVEVDVKDPSTRSYTKYKKDGTVKKQLKSTNVAGQSGDSKKIARKGRRDAKGAKTVSAKDIKVKRSPAKKPLVGGQKKLPKELQEAILKSPAKMLTKSGIKMMDKSPMNMKTPMKKSKQKVEQDYARNAIADYKAGKKKEAKYEKKKALEVAAGEGYFKSPAKMKKPVTKTKTIVDGRKVKNKLKKGTIKVKIQGKDGGKGRKFVMNTNMESLNVGGRQTLSDPNKYKSRRAARKAADSPSMMKNPMMMKSNQDGGGYAAKNPAAPARQLKKLGSVLSKHMKSN